MNERTIELSGIGSFPSACKGEGFVAQRLRKVLSFCDIV